MNHISTFYKSINFALEQNFSILNENAKKEFGYSFPENYSVDSLTEWKGLSSRILQKSA